MGGHCSSLTYVLLAICTLRFVFSIPLAAKRENAITGNRLFALPDVVRQETLKPPDFPKPKPITDAKDKSTVPKLTKVQQEEKDGQQYVRVDGSGFEDSDKLVCRLTGFASQQDGKTKAVVSGDYVSEVIMKCPLEKSVKNANEVIVEVSNDGEHFSSPLIYHPENVTGNAKDKGEKEDKERSTGKGEEGSGKATPKSDENTPRNTADNTEGQQSGEAKSSEEKKKQTEITSDANDARKKRRRERDEEDKDFGKGVNWGFGEIEGGPVDSRNWREKSLDIIYAKPHLSGVVGGLVLLVTMGGFYLLWNKHRRRNNIAYHRVRAYDSGAAENGANGGLFGLYDDGEESASGWGEWDNEWEKDNDVENVNGRIANGKRKSDD